VSGGAGYGKCSPLSRRFRFRPVLFASAAEPLSWAPDDAGGGKPPRAGRLRALVFNRAGLAPYVACAASQSKLNHIAANKGVQRYGTNYSALSDVAGHDTAPFG